MFKFRVEITEKENGYCYTGEWDNDFIPEGYIIAESEEEAEELAKTYIDENGGDSDDYIYRVKKLVKNEF